MVVSEPMRALCKRLKSKWLEITRRDWMGKLDAAEKVLLKHVATVEARGMKVLLGPSFSIYPASYIVDRALAAGFRSRGWTVVPIYCDSVQKVECNYFGGDWGGGGSFEKNCANCKRSSERLWRYSPAPAVPFSSHLTSVDIEEIDALVAPLTYAQSLAFQLDEIPYGELAKDILVNNNLVATPTLISGYEFLLKAHLKNLLLVGRVYARILEAERPDRVVSNDSYYGMWAILQRMCRARDIPFYSHYPVTSERVAFAHNDASMNLDFTRSWPTFSEIPLSKSDEDRIERWLEGARGYLIDTTKLAGHEKKDPALEVIDSAKPTLVLPTNVIWDLAALNKQILFADMVEWVAETAEWFGAHQEFQLVIRPHPAEASPKIPRTRETIAEALRVLAATLPRNVVLLSSDADITLNELVSRVNMRGLVVHTTTVGFEYAAKGFPVVTTAKAPYRGFGFTIDPVSRVEYFQTLQALLEGKERAIPTEQQTLAKKFVKFYHFHYYANLGLLKEGVADVPKNFVEALSNNAPLHYVLNAIVAGQSINGEVSYLPES